MISDAIFTVIIVAIAAIFAFMIWSLKRGRMHLIHRLFFFVSALLCLWLVALLGVRFSNPEDERLLRALDAVMSLGTAFIPVLSLFIALTFIRGFEKLPHWAYVLLVIPAVTVIVTATDTFHGLLYKQFSLYSNETVFGPYIYISGGYSYLCTIISVVIILRFAFKSKNRLYLRQAVFFSFGSLLPAVVNTLATLQLVNMSIASTPISFIGTVLFHGIAIYQFHILDIRPIAIRRIVDWLTDGYLVVTEDGLIVDMNKSFRDIFSDKRDFLENTYLKDSLKAEDIKNKTSLYNLVTSIETSKKTLSTVSFEQSVFIEVNGTLTKQFYMVDVEPLFMEENIVGFVCIYKDVTKVKDNMQKLQDSQARMMEQERLASLGQMVGGLAHNLKTPIMSISGSTVAVENLINECGMSLGDPEVTEEDYREIYGEMKDWLLKVRSACNYMSDIITAVKGQATNANTSDTGEFSIDELMKRVSLLLRHELTGSNCRLTLKIDNAKDVFLHGDINNLVQVMNNLVSNAIDTVQPLGGGEIVIRVVRDDATQLLKISVADRGAGVPEDVKKRLFRQMITSKGAKGTGLGLYISSAVMRAKFGGSMWYDENEGGGSVFGLSIPYENVSFVNEPDPKEEGLTE